LLLLLFDVAAVEELTVVLLGGPLPALVLVLVLTFVAAVFPRRCCCWDAGLLGTIVPGSKVHAPSFCAQMECRF
jgi:hypothetical protein